MTHPADAISAADLVDRQDLDQQRTPRHWVRFDDPSATSKRWQTTVCRESVRPSEVVYQREDVTCKACLAWLEEYDALAF